MVRGPDVKFKHLLQPLVCHFFFQRVLAAAYSSLDLTAGGTVHFMIAGQGGIKASQSYTDLLDTTKTLFDMVRRSTPVVRPVH